MTESTHLEILEEGTQAWNKWRAENPGIRPQLAGEDLSDLDLSGINLGEADLAEADFFGADLSDANIKMAHLPEADLSDAKLGGAELYKADLSGAYLTEADLSGAYLAEANLSSADLRGTKLHEADLTEADLTAANLSDADLSGANLSHANITLANFSYTTMNSVNLIGVQYGDFHSLRGHFLGIRGLDSCYGNAIFVRDARDQDYLDTMEHNIDQTPSPTSRRLKRLMFSGWRRIDYGRSLTKPFSYAIILAMLFGVVYLFDMRLSWGLMDYSGSAQSWITPFYYSIVTYTTLGFGDITPQHWLGEVIVVIEVILGYTTLGLLLSILANRVARQS
ncbi:MAG: pentapeptide repeat-containing protein [Chloroflexota bacterium]|nr:MAG: pentapeptide repeat-containing protein [Chloroflexota bacterium]